MSTQDAIDLERELFVARLSALVASRDDAVYADRMAALTKCLIKRGFWRDEARRARKEALECEGRMV